MALGHFGLDEAGFSPYGGSFPPFGVSYAVSLSRNSVRVVFNAILANDTNLTNPANYRFTGGLTALGVQIESSISVILSTTTQTSQIYRVTVDKVHGYFGQALDLDLREAEFEGIGASAHFSATAVSGTKVRLLFSEEMLADSALQDPANYVILDLEGTKVADVLEVIPEPFDHPTQVSLVTASELPKGITLAVRVANIATVTGKVIYPNRTLFHWSPNPLRVSIPIERFSGEVRGDLFGEPLGLVFFSPALEESAANSVLQVDDVSVCTRAYDEYHMPEAPASKELLFTYDPNLPETPIGDAFVLWAPSTELADVQASLAMLEEDEGPPLEEESLVVVLEEPFDPEYVALLNNPAWVLFDPDSEEMPFICADNTGPIPPGATQTITLYP